MDRRRFLLTSLAGVLTAPLGAEAQQTGKVPKIGALHPGSGTKALSRRWRRSATSMAVASSSK